MEFDRLVLSPSALPFYRGRDLATVKLHFLPYFLHVLKVGGLVSVMGSSVDWENVLGIRATLGLQDEGFFICSLLVWEYGSPWVTLGQES